MSCPVKANNFIAGPMTEYIIPEDVVTILPITFVQEEDEDGIIISRLPIAVTISPIGVGVGGDEGDIPGDTNGDGVVDHEDDMPHDPGDDHCPPPPDYDEERDIGDDGSLYSELPGFSLDRLTFTPAESVLTFIGVVPPSTILVIDPTDETSLILNDNNEVISVNTLLRWPSPGGWYGDIHTIPVLVDEMPGGEPVTYSDNSLYFTGTQGSALEYRDMPTYESFGISMLADAHGIQAIYQAFWSLDSEGFWPDPGHTGPLSMQLHERNGNYAVLGANATGFGNQDMFVDSTQQLFTGTASSLITVLVHPTKIQMFYFGNLIGETNTDFFVNQTEFVRKVLKLGNNRDDQHFREMDMRGFVMYESLADRIKVEYWLLNRSSSTGDGVLSALPTDEFLTFTYADDEGVPVEGVVLIESTLPTTPWVEIEYIDIHLGSSLPFINFIFTNACGNNIQELPSGHKVLTESVVHLNEQPNTAPTGVASQSSTTFTYETDFSTAPAVEWGIDGDNPGLPAPTFGHTVSYLPSGSTVRMKGDMWKAVAVPPFTITPWTRMSFSFKGYNIPDTAAISVVTDLASINGSLDPATLKSRFFSLWGDTWGPIVGMDGQFHYYNPAWGTINYDIPIGNILGGVMEGTEVNYVVLVCSDNPAWLAGDTDTIGDIEFSKFTIYDYVNIGEPWNNPAERAINEAIDRTDKTGLAMTLNHSSNYVPGIPSTQTGKAWWQVTLQGRTAVSRVVVHHPDDGRFINFSILIMDDSENIIARHDQPGDPELDNPGGIYDASTFYAVDSGGNATDVIYNAAEGEIVRIELNEPSTAAGRILSLTEVEVIPLDIRQGFVVAECLLDQEASNIDSDLPLEFVTAPFATTFTVNTMLGDGDGSFYIPLLDVNDPYYTPYDFTVAWGDGTTSRITSPANSGHQYAVPGPYEISVIDGTLPFMRFNSAPDSTKMVLWQSWGGTKLINQMFRGCSNLLFTSAEVPILHGSNMSHTFAGCSLMTRVIGLEQSDVSGVTNMHAMFSSTHGFSQDLKYWNTINVTNMSYLFNNSTVFNGDLSSWNTSNVTNMENMFSLAKLFNRQLNDWDVGSVTNMQRMFQNAESFTQDLPAWNTGNVTTMKEMFYNAKIFNGNISTWNVGKVTDFKAMFHKATIFNNNISNWNTGAATDMFAMFMETDNFNIPIGGWNTINVTDMTNMFNTAKAFNQPIGGWDTGKVTSMSGMFAVAISFNQVISGWNTANVTDMNYVFYGAVSFNNDINSWDVSKVTTMILMFTTARSYDQEMGNWDVGNVENMFGMFNGSGLSTRHLTNWNVSKVTNMANMFNKTNFNGDCTLWNTGNVTAMGSMFAETPHFNQAIGGWDVGKVTDMNRMFQYAEVFNQNIDAWDVTSVALIEAMFSGAAAYNSPMDSWRLTSATVISYMFSNGIFNQPIGSWPTSHITDMSGLFSANPDFDQDLSTWDYSNVTNLNAMFSHGSMSVANYTALIIAIDAQPVNSNLNWGVSGLLFDASAIAARNRLRIDKNWVFNGDAQA